jgi:alpha-beta hydrolase superfamily lysophospholipase
VIALILAALVCGARAPARATDTIVVRGRPQLLHVYGSCAGDPVIVSSGDGGWIHLGPHVAEVLAAKGFFVVGFNVRAYLAGFTSATGALRADDVRADYRALAEYAARGSPRKPILIGVSEGAGLSVLAASDPATQPLIGGVVALGLPDRNELGWRWQDSLIYVTHGVPDEPTFTTAAVVGKVTPVPLAAIHSTGDEFVPASEVRRLMAQAGEPKRLWMVTASNHRFSDNLQEFDRSLSESIDWIRRNQPK